MRIFKKLCRNWWNRLFSKYHLLDITAMTRGEWYDADYQMFHAVFQILVNYVEKELPALVKSAPEGTFEPDRTAWLRASWLDKCLFRQDWKECLGLAYLSWAGDLDDPSLPEDEQSPQQAEEARKLMYLYEWYKWTRPQRDLLREAAEFDGFEHIDAQGNLTHEVWGARVENGIRMNAFSPEFREYLEVCRDIEQSHENEDTKKAQQLIALRSGMWT